MSESRYKLRYKIDAEIGDFSAEECRSFGGGCDALFIVSILEPPDGSLSLLLMSKDGRGGDGGEISDTDLFKIWVMMSRNLADSKTLGDGKKHLCAVTYEVVQDAITGLQDIPSDKIVH